MISSNASADFLAIKSTQQMCSLKVFCLSTVLTAVFLFCSDCNILHKPVTCSCTSAQRTDHCIWWPLGLVYATRQSWCSLDLVHTVFVQRLGCVGAHAALGI